MDTIALYTDIIKRERGVIVWIMKDILTQRISIRMITEHSHRIVTIITTEVRQRQRKEMDTAV